MKDEIIIKIVGFIAAVLGILHKLREKDIQQRKREQEIINRIDALRADIEKRYVQKEDLAHMQETLSKIESRLYELLKQKR